MIKNIKYLILLSIISLNINATENKYNYPNEVDLNNQNYTNEVGSSIQNSHNQLGNGDTSADIERGKWYQFTKDFFSNCVSEIIEIKKQSEDKETVGSSVSSVNANGSVKTMSSCITNTYNPLQAQVNREVITQKGCKSETKNVGVCTFSLVPAMHNQNQKVAVNENSFSGVAEFSCVNGSWQQITASTSCQSKESLKCPEMKIDWGTCSGFTVESKDNTTFKLLSSNSKSGYVYMNCKNGVWQISPNHISYCDSSSCPLTGNVSWYDQNVIDIIKNKDTQVTGSLSNGNVQGNLNLVNNLPYENNLSYKKLPKCISAIKSLDGILGYSKYEKNDTTYFNNITEATQKGDFYKGSAEFKCIQGKWVAEENSICNRVTNISDLNCLPKVVRVVNGIEEKMYQCKVN